MDIRALVNSIEDALGPDATVQQIEQIARSVLASSTTPSAARTQQRNGSAVRTGMIFTAGVSLLDCSSRLPRTVEARVYDKIRRVAGHLRDVAEETYRERGVQIGSVGLSLTPVSLLMGSGSAADFKGLAAVVDQARRDTGLDFVSGFTVLADRGLSSAGRTLLDAIPSIAAQYPALQCSMTCSGSSDSEIIHALSKVLSEAAAGSDNLQGPCIFLNSSKGSTGPFGSYHGVDESDLVVRLHPGSNTDNHSPDSVRAALEFLNGALARLSGLPWSVTAAMVESCQMFRLVAPANMDHGDVADRVYNQIKSRVSSQTPQCLIVGVGSANEPLNHVGAVQTVSL